MTPRTSKWVWLSHYPAERHDFVLFRRKFTTREAGIATLTISADCRAILYLDGKILGRGPVPGDLNHYGCDRHQAPLTPGDHILAADVTVWQPGSRMGAAPWSELHAGGGFWVDGGWRGESGATADLSTPGEWECRADDSRRHREWAEATLHPIAFPCPPMEHVRFDPALADWRSGGGDPAGWRQPVVLGDVYFQSESTTDSNTKWQMIERRIPQLVEIPHPIRRIVRCDNADAQLTPEGEMRGSFGPGPARVLLFLGGYHTGFGELRWRGGPARLEIGWSEALYRDGGKLRRDDLSGELGREGLCDRVEFPAGTGTWSPFMYRAGRFVEISGEFERTTELELAVTDWRYPLARQAELNVPERPEWHTVWTLCQDTMAACTHEYYEDCPFRERMQYIGDALIQAQLSYATYGDGRLGRQALEHFAASILPEGILQSRYPSAWQQIIPGYALYWLLMLDDHHRYFGDREVLTSLLPTAERVIDFFRRHLTPEGLIGRIGHWDITDWAEGWEPAGEIQRDSGEPALVMSLIFAESVRRMAPHLPETDCDAIYRTVIAGVRRTGWDSNAGLFRDVPGHPWFSQHTNLWALLADAVPAGHVPAVIGRLFHDPELTRTTLYFANYLFEVIRKYRLTDEFPQLMQRWEQLSGWGFATCPEIPSLQAWSDCHAWSASPWKEAVRTLLGVTPRSPGFRSAEIAPLPGTLTRLSGTVPLGGRGVLDMEIRRDADGWRMTLCSTAELEAQLQLPDGMPQTVRLIPGKPHTFPPPPSDVR